MKKLLFSLFAIIVMGNAFGQTSDSIYIKKGGVMLYQEALSKIDSIYFLADKNTVTDRQGNVYKTVTIGNQTWMAENLRTTMYNDGTPITQKAGAAFETFTAGTKLDSAYVFTSPTLPAYGYYYNWYAVTTGKLAPAGWHVPTQADWDVLIAYVKSQNSTNPGLDIKAKTGWTDGTTGTDKFGFNTVPAGFYFSSGKNGELTSSYFQTTNSYSTTNNNLQYYHLTKVFDLYNRTKTRGFSVRCIKD